MKRKQPIATLSVMSEKCGSKMLEIEFTCLNALDRRRDKLRARKIPFVVTRHEDIHAPDRTDS